MSPWSSHLMIASSRLWYSSVVMIDLSFISSQSVLLQGYRNFGALRCNSNLALAPPHPPSAVPSLYAYSLYELYRKFWVSSNVCVQSPLYGDSLHWITHRSFEGIEIMGLSEVCSAFSIAPRLSLSSKVVYPTPLKFARHRCIGPRDWMMVVVARSKTFPKGPHALLRRGVLEARHTTQHALTRYAEHEMPVALDMPVGKQR